MSKSELLMKGLADANRWYQSQKSTIQGNQNIERMKKREKNHQKANATLAE